MPRHHALAALTTAAVMLLSGCVIKIEGEMGNAQFKMEGGEDGSIQGSWEADRALALGTVMSVHAEPDGDLGSGRLESSNEDVIALRSSLSEANEPSASFEAVGTGRAAIELHSGQDNSVIDFFRLDVEEAESVALIRIPDGVLGFTEELVGEQFAVLEGMPVSLGVRLHEADGAALNHHGVAEISSSAPDVLEASAGGDIVLLDANAVGEASLVLTVPEQPAANEFAVRVLEQGDVTRLELRQVEPEVCRSNKVLLIADLFDSDGRAVIGAEVDWELQGEELSVLSGDSTLQVEFETDPFVPFAVSAHFGELEADFSVERAIVCEPYRGCSLAQQPTNRATRWFAVLLPLLFALRRRS